MSLLSKQSSSVQGKHFIPEASLLWLFLSGWASFVDFQFCDNQTHFTLFESTLTNSHCIFSYPPLFNFRMSWQTCIGNHTGLSTNDCGFDKPGFLVVLQPPVLKNGIFSLPS